MPPTCLATARPFGLALSALMICARFASGIMRSVERGAGVFTRFSTRLKKVVRLGDARRLIRRVTFPQFVWRNRPLETQNPPMRRAGVPAKPGNIVNFATPILPENSIRCKPFLATGLLCLKSAPSGRVVHNPNGGIMSFEQVSTNQPALFPEMESAAPSPTPRVKSERNAKRAAAWEQDLTRTASYLMGQARTEDERVFVERLYDEALEEGPDFTNYRAKSLFQAAPKLGLDRNAYGRILNALDMIERGTYRHCRDKGKQGVPRTVARVLKYGEVRPSLDGIKLLACVCKQTVVNCLKVLESYASWWFTAASSGYGRRSALRWCRTPTLTRSKNPKDSAGWPSASLSGHPSLENVQHHLRILYLLSAQPQIYPLGASRTAFLTRATVSPR
jgi:hypothetical protein